MATHNCGRPAHGGKKCQRTRRKLGGLSSLSMTLFGLAIGGSPAEAQPVPAESSAARVERIFREAGERFHKNTNDADLAWQFGRACFDEADLARDDAQREQLARQGMAACQRAIRLDPKRAAGHYYLALNLGQLARTKTLGALKLVDEMETKLKTAIALEPAFDYAGAHRSLGLLYQDAPGRPVSIGSRTKALQHFQSAVQINPDYPGNRLCLLEAWLKWNEPELVRQNLKVVEEVLRTARGKLTGAEWESSWQEWDERWEKVRSKTGVPAEAPAGEKQ